MLVQLMNVAFEVKLQLKDMLNPLNIDWYDAKNLILMGVKFVLQDLNSMPHNTDRITIVNSLTSKTLNSKLHDHATFLYSKL